MEIFTRILSGARGIAVPSCGDLVIIIII